MFFHEDNNSLWGLMCLQKAFIAGKAMFKGYSYGESPSQSHHGKRNDSILSSRKGSYEIHGLHNNLES